jgi:PD-(D/E)XK endonuclease
MIGLTPSQKGAAAEAAITSAVIQLGLTVLRPLCEGRRYDLIVDLEPRLLRVQCKLARRRGGALLLPLQTSRHTPGGYVFTSYSAAEIDAVAVYSSELNRSFLLPIGEVAGKRGIHLRLEPAKNRQAKGVRWAEDYSLERMIGRRRNLQTAPLFHEGKLNSPDQIQGL